MCIDLCAMTNGGTISELDGPELSEVRVICYFSVYPVVIYFVFINQHEA